MTTQGIPPETITDEVSGIQVANQDREVWDRAILFAYSKFKDILERMAKPPMFVDYGETIKLPMPPDSIAHLRLPVVQAGVDLVDNAMLKLLNPICPHCQCGIGHVDYLTIGQINVWLRKGNGSKYLAALVEAIRTAH